MMPVCVASDGLIASMPGACPPDQPQAQAAPGDGSHGEEGHVHVEARAVDTVPDDGAKQTRP
eukprot:scaffold631227_cov55-Prasinocladus_malaysianus.AAC.1